MERLYINHCRCTFSPAINFNGPRFVQFNRDDPRRWIGAEEHGVLLKFQQTFTVIRNFPQKSSGVPRLWRRNYALPAVKLPRISGITIIQIGNVTALSA